MGRVRLGISLYCFTDEYVKGTFSLEDCMRAAAELGAEGIELVGTQMLPSYPYVTDQVLGEFQAMTRAYGIELVAYGANTDRGLRTDRDLTEEEMLQSAINDVRTASKLGCRIMRAQYLLSPAALAKLAPYAEHYGVKVGIEIHNPETPTSPVMQKYLEAIERSGSKFIGFIPDFGCFATRPNKPHWDEALAKGAQPELLEMAARLRYEGVPRDEARQRLLAAGANEAVMGAFQGMYGFVTFYREPDLDGLKKIMPHVIHFHGKFHYIDENLEEASIPYQDIMPVIQSSGFDGYIMAEYEDHLSGRAVEMTTRFMQMGRKLLNN